MAGQQTALKSIDNTAPLYDGPIFDGDTHIQEKDYAFFSKYLPEKYHREWLPARKHGADGRFGLYVGETRVESADIREDGKIPPPGKLKEWLMAINTGIAVDASADVTLDMYERDARVAKMREFGVDGSIMFVGEFVATFGVLGILAEQKGPEGMNAVFHAWNQYLVEEWGLNIEDRVYATPVLALNDVDWAVKEAKWLVENGVRVVVMPMGPANGKAPADPAFDPVWQVLNDAGVVVTFHVSEANFMHPLIELWGEKPMMSRREGQTAWQWMFCYSEIPVMMTMASFVYWNFFERFPNIKIASVENGAEWLPRCLYKMDKMRGMARNGYWPMGQLKERPSAIFKRHCFVVAYPEDDIRKIVEDIGTSDCILMGSDYPHAEGVAQPRDFADEALQGMSEEDIRKIMFENGRRMLPKGRTGLSG